MFAAVGVVVDLIEVPVLPTISLLSFIGMVRMIVRVFISLKAMAMVTSAPTRRIAMDDAPPSLARC